MGVATAAVKITIASSTTVSSLADLAGGVLVGFVCKAAWTAAGVTFQVSADGTTFYDLYKSAGAAAAPTIVQIGAAGAPTIPADKYISLIDADTGQTWNHGYRFIKVVSTVAQVADRDIQLYIRF